MIDRSLEAEILRLNDAEGWPIGTIASQLGLHHSVVRRVVARDGRARKRIKRSRMIDPYLPFILETLAKYPRLNASRLYDMVRERGYPGQRGHFRVIVSGLRPARPTEAYLRLRTLPGEEAQVDWAHFGRLQIGRASRPLSAFVMVLSWSRAIYVRFFLSQSLSSFLYGHRFAFEWLNSVPRRALYDNLKSAVVERVGRTIRFNRHFSEFVGHYRVEARPVAVGRGNEKGRVERAIRYIRSNFFPARRFKDLDDLNRQALTWCETISLARRWPEDSRRSVAEAFDEEKTKLLPLPASPFPCHERVEVAVGKTPYVRFDLNDYSIPHRLVRKTLVVLASLNELRILDGDEVIARHPRSWDRAARIECPSHIARLVEEKSAAGEARRSDRLIELVPASSKLLEALAERDQGLKRATRELMELLATFGVEELARAIDEALDRGTPHPQAVRHILERNRRESGRRPTLPLALPDDPRIRDLRVSQHDLKSYDHITENDHEDNDPDSNCGVGAGS